MVIDFSLIGVSARLENIRDGISGTATNKRKDIILRVWPEETAPCKRVRNEYEWLNYLTPLSNPADFARVSDTRLNPQYLNNY